MAHAPFQLLRSLTPRWPSCLGFPHSDCTIIRTVIIVILIRLLRHYHLIVAIFHWTMGASAGQGEGSFDVRTQDDLHLSTARQATAGQALETPPTSRA